MVSEKYIFCSFTTALKLISSQAVREEQLKEGLFAFNCDRGYVLQGDCPEIKWYTDGEDAYVKLINHLRKAEKEERVIWAKQGEHMNFDLINELLLKNGFKPLQNLANIEYCYPKLKREVEKSRQNLIVQWQE